MNSSGSSSSSRGGRGLGDLADMGRSPERPERPITVAWGPGDGVRSCGPILVALRAAGYACQIGSRREPVGNFEVSYPAADADTVRDVILRIAPDAAPLTVGR